MRVGYSYLRYSSPAQEDGDSIRRQTALTRAWCEKHGVTLDTTTTYTDRGKSAYHGRHRESGVLANFLADVEAGRIPRGSVLVVENLDRISRENPWDAVPLLCGIVNAGISVVTLSPSEVVYERGRDLTGLLLAVVEFGRGHSESASKADRLTAVWDEKKKQARNGGSIVTRRVPGWTKVVEGKIVPIGSRVKIIRQVFAWACEGVGLSVIVKRLTEKKVEPFGRSKAWSKAYLHKIIAGRAVLGEYQPIKNGQPDGEVIPGYYPVVIDEATWHRAQGALASRKDGKGRIGQKVACLFSGLLRDARSGSKMLIAWQSQGSGNGKRRRRVLLSADAMEGRCSSVSFPHDDVFEPEILRRLREVSVADVTGGPAEVESSKLAAERTGVEARIRTIEEQMEDTGAEVDCAPLVRLLRKLETRRQELLKQEAAARQKEANPTGAAWREARTLLDVARDETSRLRLRSLLRTAIEEVYVLVVRRTACLRLAAVQVFFRTGGVRHYLIGYKAAGRGREGDCWSLSFADALGGDDLDLRRADHVNRLLRVLESIDLSALPKSE